MADKEITNLSAAAALTGDEELHAVQGGNSRRLKLPGTWRLHDTWDHSVDGDSANVDFTGLAGAQDIMILARLVTKQNSGVLAMRVSDDNGSSFYTVSGDYVTLGAAGSEANLDRTAGLHATAATAARSGMAILHGANVNGAEKYIETPLQDAGGSSTYFVASTLPINAVQIIPTGGGNLTGGKIHCFVRGKAAT